MNVVVVVRMVQDYSQLTKENFRDQLDAPYKPRKELQLFVANGLLDLWDRAFRMPYIDYRRRVCEVAADNLAATGCRVLRGYEEFIDWYATDEDALIVPVDDDDWLAPTLPELPRHLRDDARVLVWGDTVLHNITRFHYGFVEGRRMHSNNWGVRKAYLKTLDDKKARHLVLLSHQHAETFVKANVPSAQVVKIPDRYNVYNRHVASLSFLRDLVDDGAAGKELGSIARRPVVTCDTPAEVAWADGYKNRLHLLALQLRRTEIPAL
jgi:hypothetical protein